MKQLDAYRKEILYHNYILSPLVYMIVLINCYVPNLHFATIPELIKRIRVSEFLNKALLYISISVFIMPYIKHMLDVEYQFLAILADSSKIFSDEISVDQGLFVYENVSVFSNL
mgnify:CR=1 FL=1